MKSCREMLLFKLAGQRFALPLDRVERVILATAVTPLPEAPEIVAGLINLAGRFVALIDLRRRFGQPSKALELEDYFIVARLRDREVALWVDRIGEIAPLAESQSGDLPKLPHIQGAAELEDETVLIYDLDACLSSEEADRLDKALASAELESKEGDD